MKCGAIVLFLFFGGTFFLNVLNERAVGARAKTLSFQSVEMSHASSGKILSRTRTMTLQRANGSHGAVRRRAMARGSFGSAAVVSGETVKVRRHVFARIKYRVQSRRAARGWVEAPATAPAKGK